MNQFGDEHGFADPGPAEQTGLTAPLQRSQHIDGLDSGNKNFCLGGPFGQFQRPTMDRTEQSVGDGVLLVDRLAEHIKHPTQNTLAHRCGQGLIRGSNRRPQGQTVGRGKGRTAHQMLSQMQSHLDNNILLLPGQQQGPEVRQLVAEAYIHHAAADRNDLAIIGIMLGHKRLFPRGNI